MLLINYLLLYSAHSSSIYTWFATDIELLHVSINLMLYI